MKFIVYDFDGTIYDGDSTFDFLKFLINKKRSIIFNLPKMSFYFIKYKLKLIKKEEMKECFFEIFKKFENIEDLIEEFWLKNDHKIKDFFTNKKTHKNDIIASASPYFLLEPIAKKYKVRDLFASPVDIYTGKYNGINCHGVEKVRLINNKYKDCIIEEMYSDDANADKPLLELANKSYIVKKNILINYKDYKNKKDNIVKRTWNYCWSVYHKNEEIWNYLVVGALTTIVSLITYYLCVLTILNPNHAIELQISNIISWIVAVVFAYITNRIFVFKSEEKNIKKEFTSFVGSRVLTLLLDMLTMFTMVTLFNINDKLSKIIAQIFVIIGNYLISKLFVFKKDKK